METKENQDYGLGFVFCYRSNIDIDRLVTSIKYILGCNSNYSDSLISEMAMQSITEVELYCNRLLDESYIPVLAQIAVIKLHRMNTEGLASMSMSGVSESYIDGYPANIKAILKNKRKMKLL